MKALKTLVRAFQNFPVRTAFLLFCMCFLLNLSANSRVYWRIV